MTVCQRFTATHIAKPHQPTRKPKLGGSVCLSHRTKDSETHDRQEGQQLTGVWLNGG